MHGTMNIKFNKCMLVATFTPWPIFAKAKSPHIHCIGSFLSPRTYLEVRIRNLKILRSREILWCNGDWCSTIPVIDFLFMEIFQLMMPCTIKYEGEICSVVDENMDFEGSFQTFWRWCAGIHRDSLVTNMDVAVCSFQPNFSVQTMCYCYTNLIRYM